MTNDVALYGHWICPFATRVQFALAQRSVAYELVDVPPSAVRGPNYELPSEFVEHSPKLEIPMVAVRTGDDVEYLADSIPILEWLENRVIATPLLPPTERERSLVRDRIRWIDAHAFAPMIGIYYGVDPVEIDRASVALGAALDEMGLWTLEGGWLAGDAPSLAEAVAIPIYVRLAGLRRLGFAAPLSPAIAEHLERCRGLTGWSAVEWEASQNEEFVGRFERYRAMRRGRAV